MTTHRAKRPGGLSLDKICLGLLLPLLLFIAQQGALLHEFSHDLVSQSQDEDAGPPCEVCLAFAHLHTAAPAAVPAAQPLAGLSFTTHAPAIPATTGARLPSERNRGPPAFL